MKVTPGSTDVTTYFVLRLAADGTEATGLTITNFDLQYTRSGAAPTAKVDATALAATDSAHADNKAIEIDATDQPGLYRVDWPDAAFEAGVREVILSVKCATAFTEHLRVQLETVQTGDSFARIGAPAGASVSADIAAIEAQTDDIGAAGVGLTAIPWNAAWDAEVQSEVQDALVANNLDHLLVAAVDTNFATTVHQDSVIGQIADNGGGFDRTTDSLEAIRDNTGTAGAGLTAADDAVITALAAVDGKIDTIDTNVDSILADTGTDGVVVAAGSKTGYRLSSTGVDDIHDEVVEGTTTLRQSVRLANAALGGKASGLETTTAVYRDIGDSKDRITATVDADGNRSAVTTDLT